ncbi:DUF1236 domain-containing protein [Chelatococcus composti]|jgi:hypothetical protein|uniref:DUF1236 domain-containing protein n=1 Tax=Chelatococcus composti TaxID=1743235 RepID=A0A841K5H0_9HYPH|nr:DUF1236 domain-containing protein [Chelatococcus composti]MBB6166732.1 hypothetical protein [Chelatococcus composti]MBS7734342.1 DUF1236 domain-containing protein [Chelatococcus composti]GGG26148.1 hypothetical protein GCM10008026_03020 [Chelatococcus composti]
MTRLPYLLASAFLIAGITGAAAQTTVIETTRPTIEIAPEQETVVRRYVIERRQAPIVLEREVTVGAQLPPDVVLHDFSPEIVEASPGLRDYEYVTTENEILVVDPSTRRVVRVLEAVD